MMANFHGSSDDDDDDYNNPLGYPLWMQELDDYGNVPNYLLDVDLEDIYFDDSGDSNADDYDFFFTDDENDDSDFSDQDDDHNKIFVSLQDSHVLRRLGFHKTVGRCRLPRIRMDRPETYESLYHVLEELEILLKVWKKRTTHPFTAHLGREGEEESDAKDKKVETASSTSGSVKDDPKFGVDYQEHDMEHESDSEQGSSLPMPSRRLPNELLTKKKYCQSTRLFFEIFDTDRKFEQFLGRVHKMKKHMFNAIFNNFMSVLPEDCVQRLPSELWEKIWKLTQTQYSESHSFHAGLKYTTEEEMLLERDRITDLFGSAGNFHMLVFEILYKHSYISVTPPLLELESLEVWTVSGSSNKVSYVKSLFTHFQKCLERNFTRLLDVEPKEDDKEDTLLGMIDKGRLTLSRSDVPPLEKVQNQGVWAKDNELFVTSQTCSKFVALLDGSVLVNAESHVSVVVWDVERNAKVATIHTGLPYLHAVYGANQSQPQHLFALSEDRFTLVVREVGVAKDSVTLKSWAFGKKEETVVVLSEKDCDISFEEELAHNGEQVLPFNEKTCIFLKYSLVKGKPTFILCHQNPYSHQTAIFLYCAKTGAKLAKHCFEGRHFSLECTKGNRCIVKDGVSREILFLELLSGKIVSNYRLVDLCKDASHDHESGRNLECIYEVKMDQSADRMEFAIFSQNLTCYQLFHYEEEDGEDGFPEVIASGSTLAYDLGWRVLPKVSLLDGCLFAMSPVDVHLRTHSGDYCLDDTDIYAVNIFAFNCMDNATYPIVSLFQNVDNYGRGHMMGPNSSQFENSHAIVLMNEHNRRLFVNKIKKSYVHFADEGTMILTMPQSYIKLDFHASAKQMNAEDVRQLKKIEKTRLEKEEIKRKKREQEDAQQKAKLEQEKAKKAKFVQAKNKYVGQNEELLGKLTKWQYSYGFIRCSDPDARQLGNVFVHISDIKNRGKRRMKVGQKIKFKIVSQGEEKIKAVNAQIIPPTNTANGHAVA